MNDFFLKIEKQTFQDITSKKRNINNIHFFKY